MRVFLKIRLVTWFLCIGLLLGNILLIYGLSLNILIDGYMDDIEKSMPSSYQTILKGPLEKEVEARLKESIVKRDKDIFDKPTYDQQDKIYLMPCQLTRIKSTYSPCMESKE